MTVKKGQITVFIAVGIVVLIVAGFLLYLMVAGSKMSLTERASSGSGSVQDFIQSCIESTAADAAYSIAAGGGRYRSIETVNVPIQGHNITASVAYRAGTDLLIDKADMEQEAEKYINANLIPCLDGFNDFKGADFSYPEPSSKVRIEDNGLYADVEFPVTAMQRGKEDTVSGYRQVFVPARLNLLHDVALGFINDAVQHPERGTNLNRILELADEGFNVYFDSSGSAMIYVINDGNSGSARATLYGNYQGEYPPFNFIFAMDFS